MMFPVIRVKDKQTGHEHIVGTNSHDMLLIQGGIHYFNLQNSEGTGAGGDYQFVGTEDEMGLNVEFVTFEELQEIHKQEEVHALEREQFMEDLMRRLYENRGSTED